MAVASSGEKDGFDELQLDEVVAQGVVDFEAWTTLISKVEEMYHDDIDKITLVYDSFLSEFPLCYGYWKKYAEHKARLCSVENARQIFERAVESAPYSVGLWLDYCNFGVSSFEDPPDVCRLFERGLSFVGKDYLCYNIWDKYIEFEYSQQHWNSLANIYIQTLKVPTKKLHQYYESFRKLVAIWEEEMGCQESSRTKVELEHKVDGVIKTSEDDEISNVINDLLDPSARSKALLKYVSMGELFYRTACDLDAKVQRFEQNIRRPYFHVQPLDDNQLENWHRYLDLVEMEGDFDWAVKLYERCLISCANYPEFWMRYVDYVESKGGREIASDALERAAHKILKNSPEIHLFNAWFKEKRGDVNGVHAAFQQCDQDSESYFIDIIRRKANVERRLGNYVAASNIYKEALDLAAEKRPDTLPMLYVHFAHLQYTITNNVEATREVLLNGIQCVPHSKVLLKELLLFALMHEGALQVDTVDSIVAKALTPRSDASGALSTEEWEDISSLYLEFVDFCGSIHDVRRAWNRHLKLFPHLVRAKPSFKKPLKAAVIWKMVTEGRPDSVDTHPRNSLETLDQSKQAIDGQEQFEDGNGSLNDLEPVSSEVTKSPIKDACKAKESNDNVVYQVSDERDLVGVVKDSKSNGIQREQQQEQGQRSQQEQPPSQRILSLNPRDDESQNIASPSPGFESPGDPSLLHGNTPANGHDVDELPSISGPASPQDNKAAEIRNESPGLSTALGHKALNPEVSPHRPSNREGNWRRLNHSGKGRSDVSPGNSEERLERSLSPRRRGGHGHFDDRRHRERSLSPRRHSFRRNSEDRWHRERRHRRFNRYQDNSRDHRDVRMQNQNHVVVANAMQISNAQQQTMGFVSQTQPHAQPIAYTQAQISQSPLPGNDQYGNVQNSQLYNQMWQYYYYNQQQQQQLLLQQQPLSQQQLQQVQPLQQLQQPIQNPSQQQIQAPQQPQQINPNQQQLLHLQYQQQQLYQVPQSQLQHQQQQSNEQPQWKEQQLQLQQQMPLQQQQLYQQLQLQQQEQQQQVQIQQQQQPQVQKQEELDVVQQQQQQQQAYQYQQLQQQQYLLYLQQLQQYQQSQQQPGLREDQQSLQQQQIPAKHEDQKNFQERQHRDEKPQSQPQQDDGSSHVGPGSSSQYQQDRGVERSHAAASGVAALPQSQDELPELEGTDD